MAVEVWKPLGHIPVFTVLYFVRSMLRSIRYPTMLCSFFAGSVQDLCSWQSSVEDQYWHSKKAGHSVPVNITAWLIWAKLVLKTTYFQHSKLMIFPVATLDPTAMLVAWSSIMQSHCAKNMLKTLLPASASNSSCWGGAEQAKCSLFFCKEVQ